MLLFGGTAVAAETYEVDPSHSSIIFRIKHLGVSYFYGRFNNVSGSVVVATRVPSNSSVDIQVKTVDVDTFNAKRDKHLRSPDFFDVDRHPNIRFKSTAVKKIDPSTYEVTGNLTFHGTSRPLTARVRQTGSGKDPWGNFRAGFETEFSIKRSDFGMDYMLSGIDDDVRITVSVEGIRK
jgi:polyisoprenoid-binding protein YceI